jgi:hypothetical protein
MGIIPVPHRHTVLIVSDCKSAATYDLFVGMKGWEYHLLGYRPTDLRYLFSERECSLDDLGVVTLPEKRANLADLVQGDVIRVTAPDGKPGPFDCAVYRRRS